MRPAVRSTSARTSSAGTDTRACQTSRQFHEEPQVLHYGRAGTGLKLQPGMIFTIEPMINAGRRDVKEFGNDGWTIVTKDHSLSAQWEHTVLVTEGGYEVLTLSAGSPPPPPFVNA